METLSDVIVHRAGTGGFEWWTCRILQKFNPSHGERPAEFFRHLRCSLL